MMRFNQNPAYNMELTTSPQSGADDVFGADDRRLSPTSNPLHERDASGNSSQGGKKRADGGWATIRNKVQSRIRMRQEHSAKQGLTKSGRLLSGVLER